MSHDQAYYGVCKKCGRVDKPGHSCIGRDGQCDCGLIDPTRVERPTLHDQHGIEGRSWNSAIEAAAKEADALKDAIIIFDDKDITPRNLVIQFERAACFRDCAARIRALKKNTN
jgi:hypothetical protein